MYIYTLGFWGRDTFSAIGCICGAVIYIYILTFFFLKELCGVLFSRINPSLKDQVCARVSVRVVAGWVFVDIRCDKHMTYLTYLRERQE